MNRPARPSLAPPLPDPARPVRSPCISVCRMDAESGLCEGCWRTIGEIASWGSMADAERLEVWRRIAHRRETAPRQDDDGAAPA
jgi:predicted Fe-S protein YdhL (DUF1289 family)